MSWLSNYPCNTYDAILCSMHDTILCLHSVRFGLFGVLILFVFYPTISGGLARNPGQVEEW